MPICRNTLTCQVDTNSSSFYCLPTASSDKFNVRPFETTYRPLQDVRRAKQCAQLTFNALRSTGIYQRYSADTLASEVVWWGSRGRSTLKAKMTIFTKALTALYRRGKNTAKNWNLVMGLNYLKLVRKGFRG